MNKNKNSFKKAFSLAEALVLLALSTFAVMLMLPVIKQDTQRIALKKAWQKDYALILNAYSNIKKDENKISIISPEEAIEEIKNNLDVELNCGNTKFICGTNPQTQLGQGKENVYKTFSGGHLDEEDLYQNQFLLKNGANIYSCTSNPFIANLWIDVNGYKKGPNVLGKDLFGLIITFNGIIPMGTAGYSTSREASSCKPTDKFTPIGSSGKASDYAGSTCSMTRLMEQ